MAGDFGNVEALARPLAPEGFNPRSAPGLPDFVEFCAATFRAGAAEAEWPRHEAELLGPLVYRPMMFRRNEVAWVAACAWRAKVFGVYAPTEIGLGSFAARKLG